MSRQLDAQLQELRQKLVLMGRQVQSMLELSLVSLTQSARNGEMQIVQKELNVDQLQKEIDAFAVKITALHQPVGADVRFLFMAPKISEDLERIADHAVDIQHCLSTEAQFEPHTCHVDLRIMSSLTQNMVASVVDAIATKHCCYEQTESYGKNNCCLDLIEKTEEEVDAFRDRISGELTRQMAARAIAIPEALALIKISRSLERIGDHAINIAMELAYISSGKDVRHLAAQA